MHLLIYPSYSCVKGKFTSTFFTLFITLQYSIIYKVIDYGNKDSDLRMLCILIFIKNLFSITIKNVGEIW